VTTRQELVEAVRHRLTSTGAPRLELSLILVLAGTAAFLTSVLALGAGLTSMGARYALAAAFGYLAFIGLVRLWIAWKRGACPDFDFDPGFAPDFVDLIPSRIPAVDTRRCTSDSSSGFDFGFGVDLDELWFVVLALVCAFGGLLTIGYIVSVAPVLLAEVALDAALFTAVYRRLHERDASHWAATTLRRTAVPAMVLVVFVGVVGFALQALAPDAQSVGGVMDALRSAR
jgi:hypothetical protein